jgi:hypothetical protein
MGAVMSIDTVGARPLDIGEVLGDTFAVIGRTIVVLANVSVMFIGIPAAINIAGAVLTPVSPVFAVFTLLGSLGLLVGMLLAYGAIFQVAMQDLHGQTAAADAMLRTALAKFLPMLGLAILVGLGVFVGGLLLIVPGVILALAWSVAFPALVLEDRGVFGAFGRSAQLTRNRRWSIFLLFVLVGIVAGVAELVLFALFGGFRSLASPHPSAASALVSALVEVIMVPFYAVMVTALFNQLRGKQGYGAEAVAEVFA